MSVACDASSNFYTWTLLAAAGIALFGIGIPLQARFRAARRTARPNLA